MNNLFMLQMAWQEVEVEERECYCWVAGLREVLKGRAPRGARVMLYSTFTDIAVWIE